MFPAKPIPRGGDLNVIERRSQDRMYYDSAPPSRSIFDQSIYAGMNEPSRSIFGPLTPMSQRLAQDMKMQSSSSNIGDIFDLINKQQEPSSAAEEFASPASSVPSSPVREEKEAQIAEEFDLPDDPPPEIQPPPKQPKRGKGGKASASKKKSAPSVVNEVPTDF